LIDTSYEHKTGCPRCISKGRDTSRDNLQVYGEGKGAFCHACAFTIPSDERRAELGLDNYEWSEQEVATKEIITDEEIVELKKYTGTKGQNQRGITDETFKAYACRFKYDEESGEVCEHFYPYTQDYKAAGFKVRKTPEKDFYSVGKIGKQSELFGQWKWKEHSAKYVLICAGEVDALSAYQMLENYRKSRGSDFDATPVVSSAIGESGSFKQIQQQYAWLDQAQRVIVCYDNDDAGREAVKKLVAVIPKGKMFVMKLNLKDANEYLMKGKEKQFVSAFFSAPAYSPDGIVGSGGLMEGIKAAAMVAKVPLPPFMHRVQKQMAGGIPLGVIVNLASASGTGKSTFIDEIVYFLIFNSPHRCGVITLESDKDQYGTKMLSRHIGNKIDLIDDAEEKVKFLERPEVVAAAENLFRMPDGTHRFHIIEDRDGGLESIKSLVMELIVACECKVIVCDPVSDLLEGLGNEEQALFCKWMKGIVKSHGVTFLNVCHVRKSGGGQKANSTGAEMHEEDIFGSGSLIKSAACNLLFTRNKEAEDTLERNTTYMKATKIRWTGRTGMAGQYLYDNETHTLFDKEDWLEDHGETL
jgi:KaiC/GvpD/RAD55 family RecA-like ATPase